MFITAVRSFKLKAAPANGKRHTPSCSIAQHVLSLRDPIHTQLGIEMISGLFNMFANEMDFLTLTLWTGSRQYNDFQFSYTINMVYSITKKKKENVNWPDIFHLKCWQVSLRKNFVKDTKEFWHIVDHSKVLIFHQIWALQSQRLVTFNNYLFYQLKMWL